VVFVYLYYPFWKKGKTMSSQPVSPRSATAAPVPDIPREKVDRSHVYIFNSRIFKMIVTAAVLTVSVVWILPAAASQWGATLDPLLIKSLLGTILVGGVAFGLWMYKELKYEGSFLFTIFNSSFRGQSWWDKIDDNIILGALPLEHQMDKIIKDLGITHVISVVEPFEFEPGIVRPIQHAQWIAAGISDQHIKHIAAPDFKGMSKAKIDEGVKYLQEELQKDPNAKFYIHCKAGRGRSATIVLCYKKEHGEYKDMTLEEAYTALKGRRSQVNLNNNQKEAILVSKYFKA
jgi:atypical dual specificity phosphatase